MATATCSNGHIYDTSIHPDCCPYCGSSGRTIDFEADVNATVSSESQLSDIGKSVMVTTITPEELGPTTAPKGFDPTVWPVDGPVRQDPIDRTRPVFVPREGNDPVVGWLVCVKGRTVGRDYRLSARTNTIGRGPGMDVQIPEDDTITSHIHAKLDYDALNNDFYLIPANNTNTVYINRAPVYAAQKLTAYDSIILGQTEVLFVPFCCDRFVWPKADTAE